GMFSQSKFNKPLGNWNVSSVTNMGWMFHSSLFNYPIGDWDVSSVVDMRGMFAESKFNQKLSTQWCVTNITLEPFEFSINSPLTPENKPIWGTCPQITDPENGTV